MTAKEEANELMIKYSNIDIDICNLNLKMFGNEVLYYSGSLVEKSAKQCALIAIEFAEKQFDKYCCAEMGLHWTKDNERTDGSYDHFRYLKEELKKL